MTRRLEKLYPLEWFERRTRSKKGPHVSSRHLADLVYEHFHPHKVLDLGGGTLAFANRMGELGATAWAVDGSEFNATLAIHCIYHGHDLGKPLHLHQTFDLVTSWDVIEHIPPEGEAQVIATVRRHLQKGGRALLSIDPSTFGRHHVNCHGKRYWVEKFTRAGLNFEDELTRELSQKILANDRITSKWYGRHLFVFSLLR